MYKKGTANGSADALSRLPNANTPQDPSQASILTTEADPQYLYLMGRIEIAEERLGEILNSEYITDHSDEESDRECDSRSDTLSTVSLGEIFYQWEPTINMTHFEAEESQRPYSSPDPLCDYHNCS